MEWTNLIVQTIVVIVTNFVTYLATRRKYKAETTSIEYQNMQTILSTYKTELESMKQRITEHVSKVHELEKKVNQLINENITLKGEIEEFEKKFGKQSRSRKRLEQDENPNK